MTGKYILDKNHKAVETDDLMIWAKWLETADRIVGRTQIGNTRVSTVFLGLDLRFGEGPPLLFETFIFGGKLNDEMERYATWNEAEAGHKRWVCKVKETQGMFRLIKFIYRICRMITRKGTK